MSETTPKPYKMTPERVAIILEALGDGMTQRDASMLAGISEDTLCIWKRTNSEFSEKMGQKAIEYKQKLMKRIEKAGEKDWKATAWLLERKFKKDFSGDPKLEKELLYDFPPFGFNFEVIADKVVERLKTA
jgi:(p)ppGpp synthase/HD superfamily hydrolase